MAKKQVTCPECGHKHIVKFNGVIGQTAAVRFKRTTKHQFQQMIDVPGEMVEYDRYYSMGDQLLGAWSVGVSVGTLIGYFASIPWHVSDPGLSAEIIISSALAGWTISWSWLAKERAWQLGKAIPNAVNEYLALAKEKKQSSGNVELIMDHRAESGRTIQYFGALPVDVDRFGQWAVAVLGTQVPAQTLAIANWTGSDGLFSRKEYEALLALLRKSEAVVNSPGKGNMLTGGGRRALRQHLKAHPPTPAGSVHYG